MNDDDIPTWVYLTLFLAAAALAALFWYLATLFGPLPASSGSIGWVAGGLALVGFGFFITIFAVFAFEGVVDGFLADGLRLPLMPKWYVDQREIVADDDMPEALPPRSSWAAAAPVLTGETMPDNRDDLEARALRLLNREAHNLR